MHSMHDTLTRPCVVCIDAGMTSHELVRTWRARRGLTQSDLGQRCGMSQFKISRIETGTTSLSDYDLKAIARALKIPKRDRMRLAAMIARLRSKRRSDGSKSKLHLHLDAPSAPIAQEPSTQCGNRPVLGSMLIGGVA
jgi:transcriptional regulator with XRE-family HTH domain